MSSKTIKLTQVCFRTTYLTVDLLDATGPEIQLAASSAGIDEEGTAKERVLVDAPCLNLKGMATLIDALKRRGFYSILIDPQNRLVTENSIFDLKPFDLARPMTTKVDTPFHQRDYIPEIGDLYQGRLVTEVAIRKGYARIFGIEGSLPKDQIKALAAHFAKPEDQRGFMFRPGACFATMQLGSV